MGLRIDNFSNRQFRKLASLQLSDKITTTESEQYIYLEKDANKFIHKKLIKKFHNDTTSNMRAKFDIVSKLLENYDYLNMPELVLPESIVTIDGEPHGIKMPLIESNVNMALLLRNPKVNTKQKVKYLKEILNIIQKVEDIYELQGEYFLGDIQESNFILDIDDQIIKAIDLDSSYFNGLTVFPSRYLAGNKLVRKFEHKYPTDSTGLYNIPTRETTYLQFAYMILNSLTNESWHRFNESQYYNSLAQLSSQGMNKKIMEFFESLFSRPETLQIVPEDLDEINVSKKYTITR